MKLCVVVLTLLFAAADNVDGSQTPTLQVPTGSRTGLIVGQVVDATTGQGVPEAVVMLLPAGATTPATATRGRVRADDEGRFFFSDLPAGSYSISTSREGYLRGEFGKHQPIGFGEPIVLAENERRTDAVIRAWRTASLSGTVVDEFGEPVVSVEVRALGGVISAGRLTWGVLSAPTAATDDRGVFRISGLIPGKYLIAVPSTQTTVPADVLTQFFSASRGAIDIPANEIAVLGSARTQQFGEFALLTGNRTLIPPPAQGSAPAAVYRMTYHPAAATAAEATVVALGAGEERTGIDIRLKPVPAVRVSGRLVGSNGAPSAAAVRLFGASADDLAAEFGYETAGATTDASGRFTLLAVPAGRYTLKVRTPRQDVGAAPPVTPDKPMFFAAEPLTVGTTDLTDVVINLRPVLRVEGRVEFRGPNGVKPAPAGIRDFGVELQPRFTGSGRAIGGLGADATFAMSAIAGQFFVRFETPPNWFLKAAYHDGRDVSELPLDLQADVTRIVVVCTEDPSKLSGVVRTDRGAVDASATVVIFPIDRQRWTGYGISSRSVVSVRTSKDGGYAFVNVPAGDFYIAAIPSSEADGWSDPKAMDVIARSAMRVTIADAEKKTVDIATRSIR